GFARCSIRAPPVSRRGGRLDHRQDRPELAAPVAAPKFGRVQRRQRAVQVQRVLAAQFVAQVTREFVQADLIVADRPDHFVAPHPDAVAQVARARLRVQRRMDATAFDQQRPRLCRQPRAAGEVGITRSFDHVRPVVAIEHEHAVGLEVEVALARAQVQRRALAAVGDEQADRRIIRLEHAGVHRVAQALAA
ncbi:hypothetical protein CATMIT_01636, partial [Catenibacterium mitsuokai DSM 15897]